MIIGIDIGGSKIRGLVWDKKRVRRTYEYPTPINKQKFKERFAELIEVLGNQKAIMGIGIGAAGIVKKSILISSPNIPYIKNLNFRSLVPRSISVRVDNDARCFARGELIMGAGQGSRSLFGLTIGTGVGRAVGRGGRIFKINRFEHPPRWEKAYQFIRDSKNDTQLAKFLPKKLFPLIRPYKPEVIVIGGGVLERDEFFRQLRKDLASFGLKSKIRRAQLTKNAVAIGAALLFHKQKSVLDSPRGLG